MYLLIGGNKEILLYYYYYYYSISSLRNLDIAANKLYDRAHRVT